jgi:hypothetical protein
MENKYKVHAGHKADDSAGAEEMRHVRRKRGMLWIP